MPLKNKAPTRTPDPRTPVKRSSRVVAVAPVKKTASAAPVKKQVTFENTHVRVQTAEGYKRDQKKALTEKRKAKWADSEME